MVCSMAAIACLRAAVSLVFAYEVSCLSVSVSFQRS